jgi:hypothetical protein
MSEDLIKSLGLSVHPYGGFFREVHRSLQVIKPMDERDARSASTCIYLVMQNNDIDPWHKMRSEEIFFYHKGSFLKLYTIDADGKLETKIVGDSTIDPNAVFACIIPAGVWFAGELVDQEDSFGFFSVSVSPGFHYADSEVANVDKLCEEFPDHQVLIERLHKDPPKVEEPAKSADQQSNE